MDLSGDFEEAVTAAPISCPATQITDDFVFNADDHSSFLCCSWMNESSRTLDNS